MNWIQRKIIKDLTLEGTKKYSELQPKGVEGNLFSYYLSKLVEEGYIEKVSRNYQLTTKGQMHASKISTENGELRVQPTVTVMIYAENDKGEQLLFRWKRQPFIGKVSFPYGKTHFSVGIKEMGERELLGKANLYGELTYLGDVYIKTVRNGEIFNHKLLHIFKASKIKGEVKSNTLLGDSFWGRISDYSSDELIPGFLEVSKLIRKYTDKRLFEEIIINQ